MVEKQRKTVLFVEDDKDLHAIVKWNLEREGYQVAGFEDGSTALAWLRSQKPDVAVLDLMLPGMNGLELYERMRALDSYTEIPVIIITALQEDQVKRAGYKAGALMVFRKPISPTRLAKHVTAALSGWRLPRQLTGTA